MCFYERKDPHSRNDMQVMSANRFSVLLDSTLLDASAEMLCYGDICGFLLLHRQIFTNLHAPVVAVYITSVALYIEARQL